MTKRQVFIVIAAVFFVSYGGRTTAGQVPTGPAATIPECVKYEAMVNAGLPKMCGEERALAALELPSGLRHSRRFGL